MSALTAFVLIISSLSAYVSGFTFSFTPPAECDNLTVSWQGGSPPFYLLLIPVFGTPRNISIPDSTFQNGKGSFSTQLLFAAGPKGRFLLTMSDATGFGSGGSSEVLIPRSSTQAGSCNTTDPGVAFTYELNNGLIQCRDYSISGYNNAIQPVNIMGIIPGGESFILSPPVGPTAYEWTVNVASGTSLIFMMVDSQGRQGGSSDLLPVLASDTNSCLDATSPSSTSNAPATPTSAPSSPSNTSTSSAVPTSQPASSTPSGAIVGTAIGALIFAAVLVTMGLFFLKRYRDRNGGRNPIIIHRNSFRPPTEPNVFPFPADAVHSPYRYQGSRSHQGSEDPFQPVSPYPSSPFLPVPGEGNPFMSAPTSPQSTVPSSDPFNPPDTSASDISPYTITSSSTASQRKAAMANESYSSKPARFLMHTDLEDTLPKPNADGVVELPPQYRERSGRGSPPASSTGRSSYYSNGPDFGYSNS